MLDFLPSLTCLFMGLHSVLNFKEISRDIIESKPQYYQGKFIFGADPVKFNEYLIFGIGILLILMSLTPLFHLSEIKPKTYPESIFDILMISFQILVIGYCTYRILGRLNLLGK